MSWLAPALFLASLVAAPAETPASSPPSLLEERVRNLVATRVEAGAYPALVIGVVRGGKVVDAQLSFQRAADGSVSSVVLHQRARRKRAGAPRRPSSP